MRSLPGLHPRPDTGFTRARTRATRPGHLAATVVALLVALAIAGAAPAGAAPARSVPSVDGRWFALGANVPYLAYRCDFGCGMGRGVRGRSRIVDSMLRSMSRRGVRTVRWYLFPGDAWQVQRTADGTPTVIANAAIADFDLAVRLAAKHDVYLLPVVLPEPAKAPTSWFTDPAQAEALARSLRPLLARHRGNRHVLGWELVSGAEVLVDSGVATREQVREHAASLLRIAGAAAPGRLAMIGAGDVSRIDTWTGLGADAYLAQDPAGLPPERSATRSTGELVTAEGLDAPLVIGGFQAASTAQAHAALAEYVRLGHAGALAWAWRGTRHPANPGSSSPMQDEATWRFHHERLRTGPRSRPLNPCYGPSVAMLRCPNLRMSRPTSVTLGRIGRRSILYGTNSLDSVGAGPASLHGVRDGRFTMAAKQLLHRRSGRPLVIDTDAKLLFKAIPGQYRYWKWNGAARMELWRLDSTGQPVQRTKLGPKTVYCLRDLRRRFGHLPRSPRGRVYPGCSQRLGQRRVTLGTSVGWSDVYPASYHENWIDVTGLRGCFAYVHIADPTNVIYESNEDDNASSVVVRLPWRGTNAGCPGAMPIPTTGANGTY